MLNVTEFYMHGTLLYFFIQIMVNPFSLEPLPLSWPLLYLLFLALSKLSEMPCPLSCSFSPFSPFLSSGFFFYPPEYLVAFLWLLAQAWKRNLFLLAVAVFHLFSAGKKKEGRREERKTTKRNLLIFLERGLKGKQQWVAQVRFPRRELPDQKKKRRGLLQKVANNGISLLLLFLPPPLSPLVRARSNTQGGGGGRKEKSNTDGKVQKPLLSVWSDPTNKTE